MVREFRLGDCIEKIIDYRGKTPRKLGGDWTEEGVRVISALNVHSGYIDNEDQIRCVSEDLYKKWMQDEIKRFDCFIASEGASLGENTIWDSDEKIVLGQRLYAIRCAPDKLDPWFFAMYMQTKKFRDQVYQVSTGSTVFGISQPVLLSLKLLLPDIEKQRAIGKLYREIREKIICNRKISSDLEYMAKLLYDYWFVQFDFPNEEGKPYKSSGGEMVWNEELKREIPDGWKVSEFQDVLKVCNGKDHKKLKEGDYSVYGSGGEIRKVDDFLYKGESVLIPRKGTLNNIIYINGAFWTVDTMFYTQMKCEHTAKYLFFVAKGYDFERMNTGTGVPSMTAGIINSLKVIVPDKTILMKFDNALENAFYMIQRCREENQELTSLRDFLLPMLMNGQVKVNPKPVNVNAEKKVMDLA